ncbi:MAG: hypothetical protein QW445_03420 [Candidatus Bathyarchaeia archaeon]
MVKVSTVFLTLFLVFLALTPVTISVSRAAVTLVLAALGGVLVGAGVAALILDYVRPRSVDESIDVFARGIVARYRDAAGMVEASSRTMAEAAGQSWLLLARRAEYGAMSELRAEMSVEEVAWRGVAATADVIGNFSAYVTGMVAGWWNSLSQQASLAAGLNFFAEGSGSAGEYMPFSSDVWCGWRVSGNGDASIRVIGGGHVKCSGCNCEFYSVNNGSVVVAEEEEILDNVWNVTVVSDGPWVMISEPLPIVDEDAEDVRVGGVVTCGDHHAAKISRPGKFYGDVRINSAIEREVYERIREVVGAVHSYAATQVMYLRALGYNSSEEIPPELFPLPVDVFVSGADWFTRLPPGEALALYVAVLRQCAATLANETSIIVVDVDDTPFLDAGVRVCGTLSREGTVYIGGVNHTLLLGPAEDMKIRVGVSNVNCSGIAYDVDTREARVFLAGDVLNVSKIYMRNENGVWEEVDEATISVTPFRYYIDSPDPEPSPEPTSESQKIPAWAWGAAGAAVMAVLALSLRRRRV